MRVMIVDDEPLAITRLTLCLQKFEDVTVAAHCGNGREALEALSSVKPDLAFLDIRMPGMDGFDLAEAMSGEDAPRIVFVTAYDQFAVRAFEAHAVDYLLKPVEPERLGMALDRVRAQTERDQKCSQTEDLLALVRDLRDRVEEDGGPAADMLCGSTGGEDLDTGTGTGTGQGDRPAPGEGVPYQDSFWIKDRGRVTRVDTDTIELIRAVRDYVCITTPGRTFLVRQTMKGLEERLDPARFLRVHRSAIVNRDKVRELRHGGKGGHLLLLESGEEVRVGRTYSPGISRLFNDTLNKSPVLG